MLLAMRHKEVLELKGLRRIRRLRDMTQDELASAAGVSRQAVNNLEVGRSGGHPQTWERLAEALQVSIEELPEDVP
jgi:DNA-binding XRE family transcriptional regulator